MHLALCASDVLTAPAMPFQLTASVNIRCEILRVRQKQRIEAILSSAEYGSSWCSCTSIDRSFHSRGRSPTACIHRGIKIGLKCRASDGGTQAVFLGDLGGDVDYGVNANRFACALVLRPGRSRQQTSQHNYQSSSAPVASHRIIPPIKSGPEFPVRVQDSRVARFCCIRSNEFAADRANLSEKYAVNILNSRPCSNKKGKYMVEPDQDRCGKCGAEIDASRRIDYTLKDGTRACDSCFVRGTVSPSRPGGNST
jgi:hypothetical protein